MLAVVPRSSIAVLAAAAVLAWPAAILAQKPPDKPPSGGNASSAKPPKPDRKPKPRSKSWAQQANAICRDGVRNRETVLDGVRKKPPPSVRKALLQIIAGTVAGEVVMISGLEQLGPSSSSRAASTRALALFRTRNREDALLLARLRKHWSAKVLERQARRDRATNDRLAKQWAGLGSSTCSAYFQLLKG